MLAARLENLADDDTPGARYRWRDAFSLVIDHGAEGVAAMHQFLDSGQAHTIDDAIAHFAQPEDRR